FLNDTGPIAILVVEIFAAERKSPLVIELIIDIAGDALPFCFAPAPGALLLIAVVVVEDERELIGCVKCSDDVEQVAPSLCVALRIVRDKLFPTVVGGGKRYGLCRCE